MDVDLLVTSEEIARRLDVVGPQTIYAWRKRHPTEFPEPVVSRSRLALWYWPDVEAWARATGRMPVRRTRN